MTGTASSAAAVVTSAPEFPGADPDTDATLGRTVRTGSTWFAAALIAAALPLTGLLAAGWRPSDLAPALGVIWWCAEAIDAAGVAALAWAGCPIVDGSASTSAATKSLGIRIGVALVLVGSAASALAVLLS